MFRTSRYPAGLVVAGALLAAVACNDQRTTTAPLAPSDARAASGAEYLKFRMVDLSATTLRIDGAAVSASVNLANRGNSPESGVSIRAEIVQGSASRQAASLPVQCAPADPAGVVPVGDCDMTIALTASNSAPGSGTLVKGGAVVVLHLLWTVAGVESELDTRNVDVNLTQGPMISAIALTSTTLAIEGPSFGWTATVLNPGKSLQNVALKATVVQGGVRRAAGAVLPLSCTSAIGVLPPGTCAAGASGQATNTSGGLGTLVPGPAVFELILYNTHNTGSTTLDIRTVAVTLESSAPKIFSLALSTTSLPIGTSVPYVVQLRNPGFPLSNVQLRSVIVQDLPAGTVTKAAGGTLANCGASLGDLPTGTCTMNFTTIAREGAGGTFEPGPARFVLTLFQTVNGSPVDLDVKTIDVTLLPPNPTITSITPATTSIVLAAGSLTSYSAVFGNTGPDRTGMGVQVWIRQGSASLAAGGGQILCAGLAFSELPAGGCTMPTGHIVADPTNTGIGTVVLGPATLEVQLKYFDGTVSTVMDSFSLPITLVAP
jgi:hypothetical protein